MDKQPDQARIVAWLATECHVPRDEMSRLYEHERAALAVDARVTRFLHIFAIRNVLRILRPHVLHDHVLKPVAGISIAT
jgi:hypothetical protein